MQISVSAMPVISFARAHCRSRFRRFPAAKERQTSRFIFAVALLPILAFVGFARSDYSRAAKGAARPCRAALDSGGVDAPRKDLTNGIQSRPADIQSKGQN